MNWLSNVIVGLLISISSVLGVITGFSHTEMSTQSQIPPWWYKDVISWEPLSAASSSDCYITKQGSIYDIQQDPNFPLPQADLDTFKIAIDQTVTATTSTGSTCIMSGDGGEFAKDKTHVYSGNLLIPDADPSTFSFVNITVGGVTGGLSGYAKDATHVYCANTCFNRSFVLEGADPSTFVAFGDVDFGYAKDKNHVYTDDGRIVADADPATFVSLATPTNSGSEFGRDKNAVYYSLQRVSGIDPNTVSLIGVVYDDGTDYSGEYLEDKNGIYFDSGPQPYSLMTLNGADKATFTLTPSDGLRESCGINCFYDAYDKNHKYLDGQIVQ